MGVSGSHFSDRYVGMVALLAIAVFVFFSPGQHGYWSLFLFGILAMVVWSYLRELRSNSYLASFLLGSTLAVALWGIVFSAAEVAVIASALGAKSPETFQWVSSLNAAWLPKTACANGGEAGQVTCSLARTTDHAFALVGVTSVVLGLIIRMIEREPLAGSSPDAELNPQ